MKKQRIINKIAKRRTPLRRFKKIGSVTDFKDLSQYEEQKDKSFLKEVGRKAAINAINENKALGIPVTFLHNDFVVRRMPDGSVLQIVEVKRNAQSRPGRKLKKGTVIHVRKASH